MNSSKSSAAMKSLDAERVVNVGALKLEVRKYADGRYGFDYLPPGADRIKVRAISLERAVSKAREILGAARGGMIDRLGIDTDEYAQFLKWRSERGNNATVNDLRNKFITIKKRKGISTESVRKWDHDLKAFAAVFGDRPLESVRREEVEAWLDARNVGPRRFNNILATLVSLNRFARKEGGFSATLIGAERVERRRVTSSVSTYSPEELAALIKVIPSEWLPAVALGAFCGLRPQEACPEPRSGKPGIKWENILWEKRKVDVPASVSKTRKRRFAPLTDAALAFLLPHLGESGPVAPRERFCKHTAGWARAAGMKWKPDALRHSFASNRLALTKDTPALALEMGNSPAIIFAHYLDLKHEDEAERYFGLRPETVPKVPSRTHRATKVTHTLGGP